MIGLTPRTLQAKAFIVAFIEAHGVPPTVTEIGDGLGLKGRGGVVRILRELEQRGHIKRTAKLARAIEVVSAPDDVCPHCHRPRGISSTLRAA